MKKRPIALVGDGLLAHFFLEALSEQMNHPEVIWFKGLTPTIPPVSFLHRHMGRSFETDDTRATIWSQASSYFRGLESKTQGIVRSLRVLRPTASDSRLSRSYDQGHAPHVHDETLGMYPFLAWGPRVFRYDDGFAVDARGLQKWIRAHLDGLCVTEAMALKSAVRQGNGWQVEDVLGSRYECETVVFVNGCGISHFVKGLGLEEYPGEMIVVPRPSQFQQDIAVSRLGHAVATLDGSQVCVGATFLHRCEITGRSAQPRLYKKGYEACMSGILKVLPMLDMPQKGKLWYGVRCVMHPDRRPMVGRLGDGALVGVGLGSKGMLWGPGVAQELVRMLSLEVDAQALRSKLTDKLLKLRVKS